MRAARAGVRPRIERSVVVLPAPFGPSSATTSPARTCERHAEQRLRLAVERLDGVDRQQRWRVCRHRFTAALSERPELERRTHGFSRSSAGVPSAITCPQWITEIRSARPNRNFMSCSITTIVTRALQLGDEIREARRPFAAEAGRRLVEEQQARLARRARRRSRARAARRTTGSSPDALLAREARRARAPSAALSCARRVGGEIAPAVEAARAHLGQRDQHVVQRRVVVEQVHDWNEREMPARDLPRREAGDRLRRRRRTSPRSGA